MKTPSPTTTRSQFLCLPIFLSFLFLAFYHPLSMVAQAPNISYSGVATSYPVNVAIASLTPTNTGGAVTGTYGTVTTLAGSGTAGSTDATGTAASFKNPYGIAVDASENVYVADYSNNKIRKITSAGVVTTLAGSGTAGSTNGTGAAASFNGPAKVAVDASANVYVSDRLNHKIRKITSAGVVTTLAGSGTAGSTDGTGTAASFNNPHGVVVDASGNVYVADYNSHKIRKITSAGVVTTLAGSGTAGSTDGTGTAASFNGPEGITLDASGNVYIAEYLNNKIRKITPAGVVTTLAGSGTASSTDGTGTAASFNGPSGIAIDASGNMYVVDFSGHKIRKITSAGVVTTLAGSGTASSIDGIGTAATFNNPISIALSASNNLYVPEYSGNKIRKLALTGYSINPALPTGLSINASGVISGTPTATAASATYTITGTNTSGSSTTTITFSVFISYKWKGTTTAWSTTSNWESNTAPTSTSDIIIPTTTNKPTLSANTTVASVAFSNNNQLILGSFNLTTNSLTGGSSTAYVVTDGTGSLTIKALPTATATTFPIGSSTTSYDPVSIKPTSSVDFSAKVKTTTIASDFTSTTGGITDINKVAKREWNITPTGTPGSTVVTFTNGGTAYTPTSAKVGHYTFAATNPWEELAATYATNVWTTTTSSFSPFGVGSAGGFAPVVLLVELLDFTGKNTEGGNFLTWTTVNEVNNKGFDVERSMGNSNWETLGFVKGNGKGSTYQYTDRRRDAIHTTATDYYRLRQIDNDGKETLSKVVSIETKGKTTVKVYPSVTKGEITIEGAQSFYVVNMIGQIVQQVTAANAVNQLFINDLASGLYFIRGVDTEGVVFSVKIVKE